MDRFIPFREAVYNKLQDMTSTGLFDIPIDRDTIWEKYLGAFPEGTNPMFKERTEHDCQCCKSFIRQAGGIVTISDEGLVSLWDVEVEEPYATVAKVMSEYVKSLKIQHRFYRTESSVGCSENRSIDDDGNILVYSHFYWNIPRSLVTDGDSIGSLRSSSASSFQVYSRGLKEITREAIHTVADLISQGALYRGNEWKTKLNKFAVRHGEYREVSEDMRELTVWSNLVTDSDIARLRNSSLGTLLVDLSEGDSIEDALKKYESKVAPENYKRPKALITKSMIKKAQETLDSLELGDSLARRHAKLDDITVNNTLFVDRDTKKEMNIIDELIQEVTSDPKTFKKVTEISLDDFLKDVLPKVSEVQVLLDNSHKNNLMTLIAPVTPEATPLLAWGNNFSWTYAGGFTDSIKDRVKAAGGSVTGDLRVSLAWNNGDDLDLHVITPNKRIYYSDPRCHKSGGTLDVDMNAGSRINRKDPVENITWAAKNKISKGPYKVIVNNYNTRDSSHKGFTVELEFDGKTYSFNCETSPSDGKSRDIVAFDYTKDGLKMGKQYVPESQASVDVWSIGTQQFHKVKMIMSSPNFWDDQKVGNQHTFFILEGCKNPDPVRGFYNEFLKSELHKDRKVFEVLGNKMQAPYSDDQLSGLGFSATKRDSLIVKVSGSFNRTLKINI